MVNPKMSVILRMRSGQRMTFSIMSCGLLVVQCKREKNIESIEFFLKEIKKCVESRSIEEITNPSLREIDDAGAFVPGAFAGADCVLHTEGSSPGISDSNSGLLHPASVAFFLVVLAVVRVGFYLFALSDAFP